jgi:hypothetical protein
MRKLFPVFLLLWLVGCSGDENMFQPGQSTPLAGTYQGTYSDSEGGSGPAEVTIGTRGAITGTMTIGSRQASLKGDLDHDDNFNLTYQFLDDLAKLSIHGELAKSSTGITGTGRREKPGPLTFTFALTKL